MPWLFLFHLCVPTHFVFFLLFFSVSAHTHTQGAKVVSMCVCTCTWYWGCAIAVIMNMLTLVILTVTFIFLPMHTHTQARKGSGASGQPERRKIQQRHNSDYLRMPTRSQPMTVSILHIAAFHVGDMPWLFLFRLCVPTHFVFFLLLFFFSLSHSHTHTGEKAQKRLAEAEQRYQNGNPTPEDLKRLANSKYPVFFCFPCW